MAKRKGTLLSQALVIADALSDQERLTLFDYLRAKQVLAREEKRSQARSQKTTETKPGRNPAQKRKSGKEATAFTDETVERCAVDDCDRPLDDNVHQLQTTPYYHEFVERKGTAANA